MLLCTMDRRAEVSVYRWMGCPFFVAEQHLESIPQHLYSRLDTRLDITNRPQPNTTQSNTAKPQTNMLYTNNPDTPYAPSPTRTIDPLGFGRVAIVTGCASGIGLATTQLLLAHQFQVCGLDAKAFDYALVRAEDQGRFHFHRGDLCEGDAGDEGVRVCVGCFG